MPAMILEIIGYVWAGVFGIVVLWFLVGMIIMGIDGSKRAKDQEEGQANYDAWVADLDRRFPAQSYTLEELEKIWHEHDLSEVDMESLLQEHGYLEPGRDFFWFLDEQEKKQEAESAEELKRQVEEERKLNSDDSDKKKEEPGFHNWKW